jgi:hypothetical protein
MTSVSTVPSRKVFYATARYNTYVLISRFAGGSIGVVEGFNDFGPQHIGRICDVETCPFVEFRLVRGNLRAIPSKPIWADARECFVVSLLFPRTCQPK